MYSPLYYQTTLHFLPRNCIGSRRSLVMEQTASHGRSLVALQRLPIFALLPEPHASSICLSIVQQRAKCKPKASGPLRHSVLVVRPSGCVRNAVSGHTLVQTKGGITIELSSRAAETSPLHFSIFMPLDPKYFSRSTPAKCSVDLVSPIFYL